MKRIFEKRELLFALIWIFVYCALIAPIRASYGDESIAMCCSLAVFVCAQLIFIVRNHLGEYYGLINWPENSSRYLWFLPMWFLATGNLWGGIEMNSNGIPLFLSVISMALVGAAEEIIFRGFLFRALLKQNRPWVSVLIASLTFGMGHILNLFTGQTDIETIGQILFAVSLGFLFTMVFYKSGSLLPCILAHSMIDVFSRFASSSSAITKMDWVYVGVTIAVSFLYCLYLSRLPSCLHEDAVSEK